MDKRKVKNKVIRFLGLFGPNISTKLKNACGKTGKYNVPEELFQKRTSKSNRVLISWSTVKRNNITFDQLRTFKNGITVEFLNNDLFDEENKKNSLFLKLLKNLGSDNIVSSIITIRTEDGNSSSELQRLCYNKLINDFQIMYKGSLIKLNKDNINNYKLRQIAQGGKGNDKWDGFIYISIKGGQQDTIETHKGEKLTLFNPACEYASEDVILDMELVLAYFMLVSIDIKQLTNQDIVTNYYKLKSNVESVLSYSKYNLKEFKGSLLDYCKDHYSVVIKPGYLTDPIQLKTININNFDIKQRSEYSIDFTHNEAVEKNIFYWDEDRKCILSPSRPTNIFWSFHSSNMMQQNYTLTEFFEQEKIRYEKRMQFNQNI